MDNLIKKRFLSKDTPYEGECLDKIIDRRDSGEIKLHMNNYVTTSTAPAICAPEKVQEDSLIVSLRSVISESFPNGIRPTSMIDCTRLRRFYVEKYEQNLPADDAELSLILQGIGVFQKDKVYVLLNEQKQRLRATIQELFDAGHEVIYYSCLMTHQAALLEECHLYDAPLIRKVLKELLPNAICEVNRILAHESSTILDNVIAAFGAEIKLNYAQLQERLPYLELSAIKWTLSNSNRFVWTQSHTYAQTDLIQLASADIERVQYEVFPQIETQGYVSLSKILLDESCDLNSGISISAVRNAMFIRYMEIKCSRNGNIISLKGHKAPSVYDLAVEQCKSLPYVTSDGLNAYEEELTGYSTSIAFRAACYYMVRIDCNHFVCDGSVSFDVDAVDRALMLFVGDRIVPITAITSFTSFPDVDGYDWNLYLTESFLRRFSRCFSIAGGPAQSSFVGGIHPVSMKFESYEDCLAEAVIQDHISLTEETIARYLIRKKFILRRSKVINTVYCKAITLFEQRSPSSV